MVGQIRVERVAGFITASVGGVLATQGGSDRVSGAQDRGLRLFRRWRVIVVTSWGPSVGMAAERGKARQSQTGARS